MNRFFGMMPSSEVEKEERFRDGISQLIITIQAGKKGWTIIYADSSTDYKDEIDSSENNFNKALKVLKSHFKYASIVTKSNNTEDYIGVEIPPFDHFLTMES